jgi:N-acetylglucosaminyl-diphospho-decaprenol L-rhamnosyltransferase
VSEAAGPDGVDGRVGAVVVDYDTGAVLADCITSLEAERVGEIVVVENGDVVGARAALRAAGHGGIPLVDTGRNVGYGAGANRGIAALAPRPYVLVCNPDLRVHPGAVAGLVEALDSEPSWAIVGPRILTPLGEAYPSARRFPTVSDAAGHALLDQLWKDNRFTARYRAGGWTSSEPTTTDWVSGACFLARRAALDELGGFDEAYFMFAEDMDLCWRAHQSGWLVGFVPGVEVTHIEGVSRRRHPYKMALAHHRSALRFAVRTTNGWRRALLPLAAVILALRLGLRCGRLAAAGHPSPAGATTVVGQFEADGVGPVTLGDQEARHAL